MPTAPTSTQPCLLTEVASGVDALYLSGRGRPRTEVLDALEDIRALAVKVNQPLPTIIDDVCLTVWPHGWGKYRYCIDHPTARIGMTASSHLPPVRIQPRSEYLHGVGPTAAVDALSGLVGRLCYDLALSVPRLDLYADWQHWPLTTADRARFVGRAETTRTYEQAAGLSGFDFGTRKSHTIVARIYDKTLDIERTGAEWWLKVWGDRYQPDIPVHRVEFEFARQALAEFDLTTPEETLKARADLWAYATEQWLTHRTPIADTTKARWPISPQWAQIQHPTLRHHPAGVERLRAAKRAGSIRKLLPAITGYLAAYGALAGTNDIDDTLATLGIPLRDYETISRTPFAERIDRRRIQSPQP